MGLYPTTGVLVSVYSLDADTEPIHGEGSVKGEAETTVSEVPPSQGTPAVPKEASKSPLDVLTPQCRLPAPRTAEEDISVVFSHLVSGHLSQQP